MASEKRLIDANTLEALFENLAQEWEGAFSGHAYATAWEIIKISPTVDAVEVVRCRDCMWARAKDHREPTDTPGELICQCFKHHYIPAPWGARMAVSPDDFCSYGERRCDDGQS